MPLSKVWYTSANRTLDDTTTANRYASSQLFALKELLRGGVSGTNGPEGARPASSNWTVDSSSDGVTAGAGDNLGGATYTPAKWVRAAAGVAHSWFVLRSPTGMQDQPWYVLVSWGTASDQNVIFAISKNAFTGGSITADPTSTGQSTYTTFAWMENVAAAGKAHLVIDASGSFWFLVSKNGSGLFSNHLTVMNLTETRTSGDTARVIMIADFSSTGRGVPRWPSSAITWRGLVNDSTAAIGAGLGRTTQASLSGSTMSVIVTQTNNIDAKTDMLPIAYMHDGTASHQGYRGRIPDCWYVGAANSVGSGDPTDAAPTRAICGEVAIPFSVAPSI